MNDSCLYKIDREFRFSKKAPKKLLESVFYGAFISYELLRDDAGQSVVVKNKTIMAVESFEGREETIMRGSMLSNGKSCVVVMNKLSKSDMDSVVLNADFLQLLHSNNVELLAVEEGVFLDNADEFIKKAKKLKIILMSFYKEEVYKLMGKGN